MPADQRQERAHPIDDAEDVDPKQTIPLFLRQPINRHAGKRYAGIIDADMDAAELGLDLLRRCFHRRGFGDVEWQCKRTDTEFCNLFTRALDVVALDIGERYVYSGFRQCAGDAEADAIRGAGDEGEFSGQLTHFIAPRRVGRS
jgi:hypothetical protein